MSKYTRKSNRASDKTQEEAYALANEVLKPSQVKEHRKVVAQGIQKGIDLYKNKYKAKSRELDKKLKKLDGASASQEPIVQEAPVKQHWLPWGLLALSWLGFAVLFYLSSKGVL